MADFSFAPSKSYEVTYPTLTDLLSSFPDISLPNYLPNNSEFVDGSWIYSDNSQREHRRLIAESGGQISTLANGQVQLSYTSPSGSFFVCQRLIAGNQGVFRLAKEHYIERHGQRTIRSYTIGNGYSIVESMNDVGFMVMVGSRELAAAELLRILNSIEAE